MKYKVIIPARGGSKRFPNKNIALLGGIPLIEHSIKFALEINFLNADDIWVNTDDQTIADIASQNGVRVYRRPVELGSDYASSAAVLTDHASFFEENNIYFDAIILLQPTNPFRVLKTLYEAIDIFENVMLGSLATYSVLNRKYGRIVDRAFTPLNYTPGQRMQDIEPTYYENGSLYITQKEYIQKGEIMSSDVYPYIDSEITSTIDIDERFDLEFAEFLLQNYIK